MLDQLPGASCERVVRLGVPLVDDYLDFLQGRCRPNTVLAAAYDLKVFFEVVGKAPEQVRPGDVLAFITCQRTGRADPQVVAPLGTDDEPGGGGQQHRGPASVDHLRVLRLSAGSRWRPGEPGAAWAADPGGNAPARARACR